MSAEKVLDIPLVLEKVFQRLDKNDLLNCRLVGIKNLWNREACKVLNREMVKLDILQDIAKFNNTFQSSVHGISLAPSNFRINLHDIALVLKSDIQTMELHEKEMERFIKIAGYHVKKLDLVVVTDEIDGNLVTELFQTVLYNCFPNLDKVTLKLNYTEQWDSLVVPLNLKTRLDNSAGNFVHNFKGFELCINIDPNSNFSPFSINTLCDNLVLFITEILNNAIHLQSIVFQYCDYEFANSIIDLQIKESLVKIVLSNLSPNLKQITLFNKNTSQDSIRLLIQHPTLALEDLRILSIDNTSVTPSDLKRLFNRYRYTLQELELDFAERFYMCFPLKIPLKKLRWLRLGHFEGSIEWGKLPAIEDVELVYRSFEEIIPHILSYPLNASADCLNIQWNSEPQTVLISKVSEKDGYYELPDSCTVTILKENTKFVSFKIQEFLTCQYNKTAKISGTYLFSLSMHPIHFPICNFGIIFDTDSVLPTDFQKFLNRYHALLEKMDMDFGIPLDICFPLRIMMNKLESLTLKNFQGSFEWSELPTLARIKVDSRSLRAITPSIVATPNDCKIDSMKCISVAQELRDDSYIAVFLELTTSLLPRLTRLSMGENCTAPLTSIFSSCTSLQRLKLKRCFGVTDALFCGTGTSPPVNLPEVQEGNNENEDCKNEFVLYSQHREKAKEMRTCSYIGNLTELTYLEVDLGTDERGSAFSDVSLLCGIIDCDKLETLILRSSNVSYWRSHRILQQTNLQLQVHHFG